MQLDVIPVPLHDLERLRSLSIRTFTEAFAGTNTEANMQTYVSVAFDPATLKEEISNPASRFFYCVHDDQIVGYMKVNLFGAQSDINDPESLEIERIYVLREHQNKKAGRYLLEHAYALARQHQLKSLWLGVWEKNVNAIRFYEQNGFRPVNEHTFMLGEEEQTDVIMERRID